jgi:glycosyltransferase involved in cell wall biosynthesis
LNSCSLLVSTYNRPDALGLCLKTVAQQNILPVEVVIADDGSGEETTKLIEKFQKDFPVPVKHVWHPDEGFRAAAIRNKGIALCTQDYIVQIDGDIIIHPKFIQDHIEMQKPGYFIVGSRVMLSPEQTKRLLQQGSVDFKKLSREKFAFNGLRNRFLRNQLARLYKIKGRHQFYAKGANLAFYKEDMVRINGYNEAFVGWGSEDRDVAIRLMNAGVKKLSIKMGAVCYHLYHKLNERNNELRNEKLMYEAIDKKLVRAKDGLDKYL